MSLKITTPPPDVEIQRQLTNLRIKEWMLNDFLTLKWCLLIIMILGVPLLWWRMVNKTTAKRTCLYAGVAATMAMGVFEWGTELTLWEYPISVIPIFPPLSSLNLISLPLVYSLAYQHYIKWQTFTTATAIITAVVCFLLQPALVWAGYFELLHWRYYYSFPLYLLVALSAKVATDLIYKAEFWFLGGQGWN